MQGNLCGVLSFDKILADYMFEDRPTVSRLVRI